MTELEGDPDLAEVGDLTVNLILPMSRISTSTLMTIGAVTSRSSTASPSRSGRRAAMPITASALGAASTGAAAALAQIRSCGWTIWPVVRLWA